MHFRKQDIETHDGGLPAVNVKYYGPGLSSRVAEHFQCSVKAAERACGYAWESAVEQFWEEATDIVAHHMGRGLKVYSAGRCGGWLVVDGLPAIETWDAMRVSAWGRLVTSLRQEVDYLTGWELVADMIEVNRWAPGRELIAEARERGKERGESMAHSMEYVSESAEEIETPSWLSGEWAGESVRELLGDLIDQAEEAEEELCEAYDEAATEAFWAVLEPKQVEA